MKQYKRLQATADLGNHPQGYVVLALKDSPDPGPFGLHPMMDNDAIFLASSDGPAYRLAITGDTPEVLERAARALLALARRKRGDDTESDNDESVS